MPRSQERRAKMPRRTMCEPSLRQTQLLFLITHFTRRAQYSTLYAHAYRKFSTHCIWLLYVSIVYGYNTYSTYMSHFCVCPGSQSEGYQTKLRMCFFVSGHMQGFVFVTEGNDQFAAPQWSAITAERDFEPRLDFYCTVQYSSRGKQAKVQLEFKCSCSICI